MLGKPIFFDPTGKRARLLQGSAWVLGTFSALIMVGFFAILMIAHRPNDSSFDRRLTSHGLHPLRLGSDLFSRPRGYGYDSGGFRASQIGVQARR
jgi:hypothetical protein